VEKPERKRKRGSFAARFELLRGSRSLAELSADILLKTGKKITPQAMHKWLQGGGVAKKHLELLASYFGVTEAWLAYGEERAYNDVATLTLEGIVTALPEGAALALVELLRVFVEQHAVHFKPNDLRGLRTRLAALHERISERKPRS
jgi:hypothetical protein